MMNMIGRRIGAFLIDLAFFAGLMLISIVIGKGLAVIIFEVTNLVLTIVVTVPVAIVVLFVTQGVVSKMLSGSIGKKLMDLRVVATLGIVTSVRLFVRDVFAKYIVFVPVIIGFYMLMQNRIEYRELFNTTLDVTVLLISILLFANLIVGIKDRKTLIDRYFYTVVENDIPTASEFEDIDEYIK